jgi:hypothetical protein
MKDEQSVDTLKDSNFRLQNKKVGDAADSAVPQVIN